MNELSTMDQDRSYPSFYDSFNHNCVSNKESENTNLLSRILSSHIYYALLVTLQYKSNNIFYIQVQMYSFKQNIERHFSLI